MLTLHQDSALFREAIRYTAASTGFGSRLIEKDYYCSLILFALAANTDLPLVFKGGTCLAKVHAGFYRLSEDIDYLIPVEIGSKRSTRRGLPGTVVVGAGRWSDGAEQRSEGAGNTRRGRKW